MRFDTDIHQITKSNYYILKNRLYHCINHINENLLECCLNLNYKLWKAFWMEYYIVNLKTEAPLIDAHDEDHLEIVVYMYATKKCKCLFQLLHINSIRIRLGSN